MSAWYGQACLLPALSSDFFWIFPFRRFFPYQSAYLCTTLLITIFTPLRIILILHKVMCSVPFTVCSFWNSPLALLPTPTSTHSLISISNLAISLFHAIPLLSHPSSAILNSYFEKYPTTVFQKSFMRSI